MKTEIKISVRAYHVTLRDARTGEVMNDTIVLEKSRLQAGALFDLGDEDIIYRIYNRRGYRVLEIKKPTKRDIETAFEQLAYALDVLAEFSGATPGGDLGNFQIMWDWDMSMMESSTETFVQMSELESRGLILPERLNAWVTGQSEEAAKKEIELAKSQQFSVMDNLLTDP